jgi:hypothetical protein
MSVDTKELRQRERVGSFIRIDCPTRLAICNELDALRAELAQARAVVEAGTILLNEYASLHTCSCRKTEQGGERCYLCRVLDSLAAQRNENALAEEEGK